MMGNCQSDSAMNFSVQARVWVWILLGFRLGFGLAFRLGFGLGFGKCLGLGSS